jgi:hypothetical protein
VDAAKHFDTFAACSMFPQLLLSEDSKLKGRLLPRTLLQLPPDVGAEAAAAAATSTSWPLQTRLPVFKHSGQRSLRFSQIFWDRTSRDSGILSNTLAPSSSFASSPLLTSVFFPFRPGPQTLQNLFPPPSLPLSKIITKNCLYYVITSQQPPSFLVPTSSPLPQDSPNKQHKLFGLLLLSFTTSSTIAGKS